MNEYERTDAMRVLVTSAGLDGPEPRACIEPRGPFSGRAGVWLMLDRRDAARAALPARLEDMLHTPGVRVTGAVLRDRCGFGVPGLVVHAEVMGRATTLGLALVTPRGTVHAAAYAAEAAERVRAMLDAAAGPCDLPARLDLLG